ncbi:MAG TPA: lamin tail domain-containing protein [Solirubrobacteraceae bacterium]|nr:lamin tail domain-containing protein [Solirubrobacteraceae bacterium]
MRRLAVVVLMAAAGLAWPGSADARSGPCLIPGSTLRCALWTAKVVYIADGDTFYADLRGDGSRRIYTVRITGVNAMEQTVYSAHSWQRRGYCHSLEATSRLEGLIRRGGGIVRLAALDASSASHRRWRRAVAVKIKGRWRDVGRLLVSEGHALWLPNGEEWAWNAPYSLLAERAAAAHRGIWNTSYCGKGPSDAVPLRLTVNDDQPEWVRIRNLDPVRTINLGGWTLGDSTPSRFTLPDWVTVTPGETLTIRIGRGIDTWTELWWARKNVFDNPGPAKGVGDGAYLFDPQGDLRAWMTYPCRLACSDPYAGVLRLSADPKGRESVTVRNAGSATVDLDGYRLSSPPYVYAFGIGTMLAPGEELAVDTQGDPDEDSRLEKHWGRATPILNDGHDVVRLSSLRGVPIACVAIGTGVC